MRCRSGSGFALSLVVMLLVGWLGAPAVAQEEPPPPPPPSPPPLPPEDPNQGLAFLVISLTQDFGSDTPTVVAAVGTLEGGSVIGETAFVTIDDVVLPVTLPGGLTLGGLDGHECTVIGTFQTTEEEIHLVTGDAEAVDADVQEAVYWATRDPGFSGLFWFEGTETMPAGPLFPTTTDIAEFIQTFGGYGEDEEPLLTVAEIEAALFETADRLNANEVTASVDADGEVFPHDPDGPLFSYGIEAGPDGTLTTDFCEPVKIDIKPGSDKNPINFGKKGSLPVVMFGSEEFDVHEIEDETWVTIGSVSATRISFDDVDGDGEDDLVCHFDVPALVLAGEVDEFTTSLAVQADVGETGVCFRGSDSVTMVLKK